MDTERFDGRTVSSDAQFHVVVDKFRPRHLVGAQDRFAGQSHCGVPPYSALRAQHMSSALLNQTSAFTQQVAHCTLFLGVNVACGQDTKPVLSKITEPKPIMPLHDGSN